MSLSLSRSLILCGFLSTATLSACSSGSTKAQPSKTLDTTGIVREGTTTLPALDEFLGGEPDAWPWAGGQFQTPSDQAVLPSATPESFTWVADSTTPPAATDVLDPTKQQGQVFLLVFSTPTAPQLLRVFTSLTSYTPSDTDWQTLVGAADVITLSITSATFENDELTSDGGPHAGQTIQFTIQ